jgi:hypothetical protein
VAQPTTVPSTLDTPVHVAPQPTPPVERSRRTKPPTELVSRATKPPVENNAVVRLQCDPWCTVELDGKAQGEGAMAHVLHVGAGRHALVLHRLEDVQRRVFDVSSGGEAALRVKFD